MYVTPLLGDFAAFSQSVRSFVMAELYCCMKHGRDVLRASPFRHGVYLEGERVISIGQRKGHHPWGPDVDRSVVSP